MNEEEWLKSPIKLKHVSIWTKSDMEVIFDRMDKVEKELETIKKEIDNIKKSDPKDEPDV